MWAPVRVCRVLNKLCVRFSSSTQAALLPRFATETAEQVADRVSCLQNRFLEDVAVLEGRCADMSVQQLLAAIERTGDGLQTTFGHLQHLNMVSSSATTRAALERVQPGVVEAAARLNQSQTLFTALNSRSSDSGLSPAEGRALALLLRDFKLAGVALGANDREELNEIQRELQQLSTRFSNNVLDSTKEFGNLLTTPDQVRGLPQWCLALMAQDARDHGHPEATSMLGPWRLSLADHCVQAVLSDSVHRELREEVLRKKITVAAAGPTDNTEHIVRILQLRLRKANILGFNSFAHLSVASKMVQDPQAVVDFITGLHARAKPAADRELLELRQFAVSQGFKGQLKQWDIAFYEKAMKLDQLAYSEEESKKYFPFSQVLAGMFSLAERLFGVHFIEKFDVQVWHSDVRFFELHTAQGHLASFYLDSFSRPAEKRGGAWMDVCHGRSTALAPTGASVRLPVAHLVCNFTPASEGREALMKHQEVLTLFHEFGHGLQHLLTKVDIGSVAGINGIEWDAVELPSQWMENWCYHFPTVCGITRHSETEVALPRADFDKMVQLKKFRAGSAMQRQLYLAMLDMKLHLSPSVLSSTDVFDIQRKVAADYAVLPLLPEDRFLCGFLHIFASEYAAGYYSYKYAEMMSADAYQAFEDTDGSWEALRHVGKHFGDTVLGMGGSRDPATVFKLFRNRAPEPDALLNTYGL